MPVADALAAVLQNVYEDCKAGGELPLSWLEAALVFLPKKDAAVLQPHEWRPIALMNCMSKVFARAVSFKLLAAVAPALHPAQCGFVPNKGTHQALMNIEESALALGSQAPQASLLLLDLAQAFPSVSRRWLRRVIMSMGFPAWLVHYLLQLLSPARAYLVWRNKIHDSVVVSTGVPQGHPLAPVLFLLGLDPWIKRLSSSITPPAALALFADDISVTQMCLADLAALEPHLALAEQGLGLRVRWEKSNLIPLGPSASGWRTEFEEVFPRDHAFRQIEITCEARLLGFWVGRGPDLSLEKCAQTKMEPRLAQIKSLKGGTAMNRCLLSSVLLSCATHVLRVVTPQQAFIELWGRLQDDLNAAPKKWFRPFQAHAKRLFGLPGSQLAFSQVRDILQFRMLQTVGEGFWDKIAMLDAWYLDEDALLMHPLEGWRKRGCLATLRSAWQRAYTLHAIIRRGPYEYSWANWREILTRIRGGIREREATRRLVRDRVLLACSSLPPVWVGYFRAGLLEQATKRLSRISPNATVALLRFFLGGVPEARVRRHLGDCPFCCKWHLHQDFVRRLFEGCYVEVLANCQGFRWLAQMPRHAIFLLMLGSGQPQNVRRLASLSRVLMNTIWASIHERSGTSPSLSTMARRQYLR